MWKQKAAFVAVAGITFAFLSAPTLAQERGGGGGGGSGAQAQEQSMPRPKQMQQNKRMEQEMDRERSMQQKQLKERIRDSNIYGREFMSRQERNEYRQRLNSAASDKEWAQIRAEHQTMVQDRARSQGKILAPPVYGQHMMTVEEQKRYTKRLQAADSDAERNRIREEHREMIRARARDLGVDQPS